MTAVAEALPLSTVVAAAAAPRVSIVVEAVVVAEARPVSIVAEAVVALLDPAAVVLLDPVVTVAVTAEAVAVRV